MMTDDICKLRTSEEKQSASAASIDSIIIYDNKFTYGSLPHLQFIHSYLSDFFFIKNFPKVLEAMSNHMDAQDFREMLRCAIQSNLEFLNDGKYLDPKKHRLTESNGYGFLLKDFLGHNANDYIVMADYFGKKNPVRKTSLLLDAAERTNTLSFNILNVVKSDVDYKSEGHSLEHWLNNYIRTQAFKSYASHK